MSKKIAIDEVLKNILNQDGASTQEEICNKLARLGIEITQSSVSRWLRRIHAIKVFTDKGTSYVLPKPETISKVSLLISVSYNNSLIVVRTAPGSASWFAGLIDKHFTETVLGTLAGDDTVFITPVKEEDIPLLAKDIEFFLQVYE